MRKEFEVEDAERTLLASQELARKQRVDEERRTMAVRRQADEANGSARPNRKQGSR